jgi:hypothetical protein
MGNEAYMLTKNEDENIPSDILTIVDGKVVLPDGHKVKVIDDRLLTSIYGNQIVRSDEGGTFEATVRGKRANGVVQGFIIIPPGIVGMKDDGSDEGTILLKDNHGGGSTTPEDRQYKIWFEYEEGGKVDGIILGREHNHPSTEKCQNVKYENQPRLEAGGKLEFIGSYQDTADGEGVRLRMFYKDSNDNWLKLFDHVDYGDKKNGRPYTGKSGVQDGTRVDGRVGGGKPSNRIVDKYKDELEGKPITTTTSDNELKRELAKLATSAIWAREIEPDDSDLHDGQDDPLSMGEKNN